MHALRHTLIIIILLIIASCNFSKSNNSGVFALIKGENDKMFLLDTTKGDVWESYVDNTSNRTFFKKTSNVDVDFKQSTQYNLKEIETEISRRRKDKQEPLSENEKNQRTLEWAIKNPNHPTAVAFLKKFGKLSTEDLQAIQWAKTHPDDPRANKIFQIIKKKLNENFN